MGLPSPDQVTTWGGKLVVDRDGAAIGTVTQIYSDNATGLPEWATIRLGEATAFLPLLDAEEANGQVRVQVKRDDVAKAPMVGPGHRITPEEEARLYRHYEIEYTPERSPSGLPRGVGPVPTRAQLLMRRAQGLEVGPLVLAAAFAAASVLVVVLGVRGRSRRSPAQTVLASGGAAVGSSDAARAARRAAARAARDMSSSEAARAARRAARDALLQALDAADAVADALDEPGSGGRRARTTGRGRGTRRG